MTGRTVLSAAILGLSLFLVHPGHTQPYPARPVKIIVPTVAGGTVDVITRLIASDLSSRLGVSFFVDNRSGAGNTLGSREAARSDPDGYTLLMSSGSVAHLTFLSVLAASPHRNVKCKATLGS